MKYIAIAAAASAMLMMGTAQAQQARAGGAYAELGYTQLKSSGSDAKPSALRGIAGYEFHPNVAVEGMLAFGIRSDDQTVSVATPTGVVTGTVSTKLSNAYGVYVKPKYNVADSVELFGRLGYTHAKFNGDGTVTAPGATPVSVGTSGSEGGVSYGVGANFKVSPAAYVGVDYMRYYRKDGVNLDGITVGVGFRF